MGKRGSVESRQDLGPADCFGEMALGKVAEVGLIEDSCGGVEAGVGTRDSRESAFGCRNSHGPRAGRLFRVRRLEQVLGIKPECRQDGEVIPNHLAEALDVGHTLGQISGFNKLCQRLVCPAFTADRNRRAIADGRAEHVRRHGLLPLPLKRQCDDHHRPIWTGLYDRARGRPDVRSI